jgi:hypothetical protein
MTDGIFFIQLPARGVVWKNQISYFSALIVWDIF